MKSKKEIKIGGYTVQATILAGNSFSTISLAQYLEMDLPPLQHSAKQTVVTARGKLLYLEGFVETAIEIDKLIKEHCFYVCTEMEYPVTLGGDFFRRHNQMRMTIEMEL